MGKGKMRGEVVGCGSIWSKSHTLLSFDVKIDATIDSIMRQREMAQMHILIHWEGKVEK